MLPGPVGSQGGIGFPGPRGIKGDDGLRGLPGKGYVVLMHEIEKRNGWIKTKGNQL